ncbi:hypothetical protein GB883_01360 [Georgenia thermotolerans]|uniref:Uncharacterized protein n=1 Tax=Georgenia thermotolerans TaxID=527326 RepID=A0A7J5UUD3_9MICO|nr:hypothetical protein GB883_01360 [Georgenia thermotolerans]
MRPHLINRVGGLPKKLASAEATALLSWVATLPEPQDLNEAADLLLKAKVGFAQTSHPLRVYLDEASLALAPDAWSRLIAGMLDHTAFLQSHTGWSVRRIAQKLAEIDGDQEAITKIQQALYNLGHGER